MRSKIFFKEEEKEIKSHDIRLLKRLALYAVPYTKTILMALFLTVFITLLNLAFPYFAKIAVDRYILSSWYIVSLRDSKDPVSLKFNQRYGHLLEKTDDNQLFVISHAGLKKIDPAELTTYRTHNIVGSKRNYRTSGQIKSNSAKMPEGIVKIRMPDGSLLIEYELLYGLPKKKIKEVRSGDIKGVTVIGIILIVSLFFWFGLGYGEYYLLESVGQRMMQDIRLDLFKRIQSQSISFFDSNPLGRLITRVTNDIQNLNEMFKSVIITIFKDLFLILGILCVLFYLDLPLALVCVALIPLVFSLTFIFSNMARQAYRELRIAVAKLNSFLQERVTGMHIIQLFVGEIHQMRAFSRINHENYLASMKQVKVFAIFMPLMDLGASFAVALIIWYGGLRVIQDQLTLGTLIAFVSYIRMFFKPIRDLSEKFGVMQSAMASTERIFESMDHLDEIPEPESPAMPGDIKGIIKFENVFFSYEEGKPVLHDISFKVYPGETVAIVGATGSGKTTLVSLMERFYDPDHGSIMIDEVDLRKWPKSELRKKISLVMQDVFLFAGNLSDNITLGRDFIGKVNIEEAAKKANANSFIEKLPDGFQQELGEGGYTLSSGQRQLLSFARALAANSKILILDEATSSVDPETEQLIQDAISKMALSTTTIVVAHRLSTIRNADRILVMHHGRLVEQGNHEELMKLEGVYFRLNRLQEKQIPLQ